MTSNPKNYFFQKLYEKYYDVAPYIHDDETISDYRERIRRIELTNRAWNSKKSRFKTEPFVPFEGVLPIVIDDSLGDENYDYQKGFNKTKPEKAELHPNVISNFRNTQNTQNTQNTPSLLRTIWPFSLFP